MKWIIALVAILATRDSFGQTLEEWTAQSKTQRKYLIDQIVAFAVYDLKQKHANQTNIDKMSAITEVKKADLSQHSGYLASLKVCNNVLRNAVRSSSVFQQLNLGSQLISAQQYLDKLDFIHPEEKLYASNRLKSILKSAKQELSTMESLINPGITSTDGTYRLERTFDNISSYEQQIQDVMTLLLNAQVLNTSRVRELNELKLLKIYNNK
jgi:hypothetical protein